MRPLERIVEIVNDVERRGHALNELAEIRAIAQATKTWQPFSAGHPQLGQSVDVRVGDGGSVTAIGAVTSVMALGNGWVGIQSASYTSMAVRPEYEWREHQDATFTGTA